MRVPKLRSAVSRTPARLPGLTFGSVSSLLSVALWAAFWILALLTLATVLLFIVMAFVPPVPPLMPLIWALPPLAGKVRKPVPL